MTQPIEEEVLEILAEFYNPANDKWEFLLRWADGTATWEPFDHLTGCNWLLNKWLDDHEQAESVSNLEDQLQ